MTINPVNRNMPQEIIHIVRTYVSAAKEHRSGKGTGAPSHVSGNDPFATLSEEEERIARKSAALEKQARGRAQMRIAFAVSYSFATCLFGSNGSTKP